MPGIGTIDDLSAFAPQPQAQPRDQLGQEDFLTLMITQFQNQDPFEPMDNGEFLGQLAQFSTVNGIESLNSSFDSLSIAMQDNQALQAASLVGQKVLAVTDIAHLDNSGPMRGALELTSSAGNVQIDITDETGQLVQRLDLGQQAAGLVEFEWDGISAQGERADTGFYQVSARVARGQQIESVPTVIESQIQSVTLGQFGGGMTLNLEGGQEMPLGQVYRIIG
ncbi:MAG: flagellar hook assembly protein FlgD [Woeseiaceae bacterium]|nr:flagellar hook assembly protein FlgD [Woeseiaceae bacterium]